MLETMKRNSAKESSFAKYAIYITQDQTVCASYSGQNIETFYLIYLRLSRKGNGRECHSVYL